MSGKRKPAAESHPMNNGNLRVEYRRTDSLIPYPRNARKHPKAQVAQIAGSIAEFGFLVPVLVDGAGGIIAGHGRVLAAQRLGMESVPCIQATHLTEAQKRAFVLADNKLTENAGWDDELLRLEMTDLNLAGFDLKLTGFDEGDLSRLLTPLDSGEDNPAPDVAKETPVRLGDLWLLGAHRLVCGDATDGPTVRRLLEADVPFLMVTDPPYGVEYEPEWRDEALGKQDRRLGRVEQDHRSDWSPAWALFPGGVAYVWTSSWYAIESGLALRKTGFGIRAQIVWDKGGNYPLSRGHYHWQHEPCWYAVRQGASARWAGDRKQTTVWAIARVEGKGAIGSTPHSTQKPLECMARPIRNHGAPGDFVYDPFLGSGTTLIACERLGRICLGMEIAPEYVDVAIRRWHLETGKPAVREDGGLVYDHTGWHEP